MEFSYNQTLILVALFTVLSGCSGDGSSGNTIDITAPTVSSVTPPDDATKVSRTTPIIATFDEDLFAVSVDNSSFSFNNGSRAVPATISINSANEVTLQANSKLSNLTSYTATLNTSLTDMSGNALNENYTWSFTTEDGGWSNAALVEVGTDDAALPQLSMDDSGNALAVWMQGDDILANRYSGADGSWGTATIIETEDGSAHLPNIAIDSNGNAWAVWVQSHDSEFSIWANRFSVDNGSWGQAVLIEQIDNDAIHPEIAVDNSGNALAVWAQQKVVLFVGLFSQTEVACLSVFNIDTFFIDTIIYLPKGRSLL